MLTELLRYSKNKNVTIIYGSRLTELETHTEYAHLTPPLALLS